MVYIASAVMRIILNIEHQFYLVYIYMHLMMIQSAYKFLAVAFVGVHRTYMQWNSSYVLMKCGSVSESGDFWQMLLL